MTVSKKIAGVVGAIALSLGAMTATAQAEDKLGWSWTVTGASDYMFRGISYTSEDPTVNSYLEFTYNIFYLGLWTSNIDTGAGPGTLGPWEQDVYLGFRTATGPINWDVSALYYIYGVEGPGFGISDSDYFEFKIGATYSPVTNLVIGANVYLTPDQGYAATENISVEGTLAYTLPSWGTWVPTISGLYGFSDSQSNSSYPTGGYWIGDDQYSYWNAGLKITVDKFFMDYRYWGTDNDDPNNLGWADDRFVFSAGVTLP